MSDEPVGDETEKEEGEDQAGGDAPAQANPQSPPYSLSDYGLGKQWFMVADDVVKDTFGSKTLTNLNSGESRWAARFSGDGLDGPSADPIRTAKLLERVAMAVRWFGNGLFPQRGVLPGFVQVQAAHSIVLEFAIGREEKPVVVPAEGVDEGFDPDDEGDQRPRKTLYPTVEGGRYFAALLASSGEPDQLVERLQPVGRRAVGVYESALSQFVEYGVELDVVVPAIGEQGEAVRRHVNFTPENGAEELAVLKRVPEDLTSTEIVEGLLYMQNSKNRHFSIEPEKGRQVSGEFDMGVVDKLGNAWNKKVRATIEVIGPREQWMPRAGRMRRRLKDVEVLDA